MVVVDKMLVKMASKTGSRMLRQQEVARDPGRRLGRRLTAMSFIPSRHSSSAAASGSSASSGQITGIPVCSRHTGTSGTDAMNSALASAPHPLSAGRQVWLESLGLRTPPPAAVR